MRSMPSIPWSRPTCASARPTSASSIPIAAPVWRRSRRPSMPLLKNGLVATDHWIAIEDEAPLPEGRPVLVSHARWLAERAALVARKALLGIRLPNSLNVLGFGAEAGRFDLIEIGRAHV